VTHFPGPTENTRLHQSAYQIRDYTYGTRFGQISCPKRAPAATLQRILAGSRDPALDNVDSAEVLLLEKLGGSM
jgi:hypothetical protein